MPSTRGVNSSIMWTNFSGIPVHGDKLIGKADNNIRLYFDNIDGFGVDEKKSPLLIKYMTYFNNLLKIIAIDVVVGTELRTQWDMVLHSHSLLKVLNLRDGTRCCSGHNRNDKFTIRQLGGTFLAAQETMGDAVLETRNDMAGLSRWC